MKKVFRHIEVFAGIAVELSLTIRKVTADDIQPETLEMKDISKDLKRHLWRRYGKRKLEQIDMVVVHHSATTSGTPEAYARFHVSDRGWPGIGYHYVIQKDATIFQTNSLETISYHVSGQNTNAIGICLTGNYDQQKPPELQLDQCAKLIVAIKHQLGRDLKIRGHAAFSSKSCPGKHVNMEDIIQRVNEIESSYA